MPKIEDERKDRSSVPIDAHECWFCGNKQVRLNNIVTIYYIVCWQCGTRGPMELSADEAISSWGRGEGDL
jgi:transcription elongation factor Elf1